MARDASQNPAQAAQGSTTHRPISDEEILRKDLEAANQKIQELTEMSKRALADLANYKKRVEEERVSFAKFANLSLFLEIIPVLNDLKRALKNLPQDLIENEWVKGIMNIERQFQVLLQKHGLREIPDSVGQPFNPRHHEIIAEGPGEKDIILEELDKGYVLGDKVISPTKVKVGSDEKT